MKIGDKVKCSNKHTYTLAEGDSFYTYTLIDEVGEVVNLVHDYYLEDCLSSCDEDYNPLCIGTDNYNHLKYTDVLELVEV